MSRGIKKMQGQEPLGPSKRCHKPGVQLRLGSTGREGLSEWAWHFPCRQCAAVVGSTDSVSPLGALLSSPPHCTPLPQWGVQVGGGDLWLLHSLSSCLLLAVLQGATGRKPCSTANSEGATVEAGRCTSSSHRLHH